MKEIKVILYKNPENYDSDDIRFQVDGSLKGFGFISRNPDEKTIALIRCPICNKENYAFNVSSGECSWCDFSTKDLVIEEKE